MSICEKHGLPYSVHEVSLPDLDAAKAWMIANQLGRRNLSPDLMVYYRGQQYNLQKQQGKRTDLTSRQSGEKFSNPAATLAAVHQVGKRTIERDGAYAEDIELLARHLGPEVRQLILGTHELTRRDVQTLAGLAQADPEMIEVLRDAVQSPEAPSVLQEVARAARCGICHRLLSDPASLSRGIGPVCAGHESARE